MTKRRIPQALKTAASGWSQDNATRLSAALAYYTMLSIAPLLIFTIKFIGLWYRNSGEAQRSRYKLSTTIHRLAGGTSPANDDRKSFAARPGNRCGIH